MAVVRKGFMIISQNIAQLWQALSRIQSFKFHNIFTMQRTIFIFCLLFLMTRSEWITSDSTPQVTWLGGNLEGVDSFRAFLIKRNHQMVRQHNANPDVTFKMEAYSRFVALTDDEVRARYFMKISQQQLQAVKMEGHVAKPVNSINNLKTIYSIDLTNYYGTVVQNQGACGNCYAFSATDTVNMNYKKQGKSVPLLSFQQLTDCSYLVSLLGGANRGCGGGNIYVSMEYIRIYGLTSLAAYPQNAQTYTYGTQQSCSNRAGPYRINQWLYFNSNSCVDRISYLLSGYAISVFIAGGNPYFWNYKSGVLPDCSGYTNIDHAVVMVGAYYDSTSNASSYIIYKNSWGSAWGESGKIRISLRGRSCQACQVGTFST